MMFDSVLVIGVLGAVLMLAAFVANQFGVLDEKTLLYDVTNFVAGILLVVYGALIAAWPFVVINAVWAVVSLRDVGVRLARRGENG